MSIALGVLALFFAALLILSIRKNSKIYARAKKEFQSLKAITKSLKLPFASASRLCKTRRAKTAA